MKMNKKMWIIGAIALVFIAGLVWYFKSKSDTEVISSGTSSGTSAVEQELKTKVTQKMAEIKVSEWGTQLKAQALAQGQTEIQSLAIAAIWSLKHDGIIPMDSYGAGDYGHIGYVKANY